MTTLIAGGAGFIGSNFIPYFLRENLSSKVINLDKLTYAGDLNNLCDVHENKRHIFIQGDICDKDLVNSLFEKYKIDSAIHFAAQSHVDNSIDSPHSFIKTNIEGTFTLLESAKQHWEENHKNNRFHHISKDEVYGSLGSSGFLRKINLMRPIALIAPPKPHLTSW